MTGVALRVAPSLISPDVLRAEVAALEVPEDVVEFAAKAEALRRLAKAVYKSSALAREFAEIRLRAERRGGEMLAAMPKAGNGREQLPTMGSCGVERHQSSRWQRVASIPDAPFEAFIAATYAADSELTTAAALKLAKRLTVTPVNTDQRGPGVSDDEALLTFPTIVIDPPWRYDNVATRGAAEDHYPTMALDDLAALDIPAADNAHIYLWVTNGFIRQGFDLLDAWDFTYKTTLTWCKPQIGMGNWFRNSTEHVLFGVRGSLPTQRNDVSTWFLSNRTKHSAKPECFYDLVESCSPAPWFEMFSRRKRLGDWHVWGNESMGGRDVSGSYGTVRRFKVGDQFAVSGVQFRVRAGTKKPGDLVMDWLTTNGWRPIGFDAIALPVDFLYENEDWLYPRPRQQGGEYMMKFLRDAIKNGHVCAIARLESEKAAKNAQPDAPSLFDAGRAS